MLNAGDSRSASPQGIPQRHLCSPASFAKLLQKNHIQQPTGHGPDAVPRLLRQLEFQVSFVSLPSVQLLRIGLPGALVARVRYGCLTHAVRRRPSKRVSAPWASWRRRIAFRTADSRPLRYVTKHVGIFLEMPDELELFYLNVWLGVLSRRTMAGMSSLCISENLRVP